MKRPYVGDIDGDLHDILHVRFVGDQDGANVLKNLHRLGSEIAFPNHITGFVESDLPGDEQQRTTRYAHRVRIIGFERRCDGRWIADLRPRTHSSPENWRMMAESTGPRIIAAVQRVVSR